ncbi:response regulator [Massilia sp. Dwa41.01b]|uniref:response regulator n=1 Tax=Massilia sp. Dwa41.01b TaxID=2709302 RepID=UPI001E638132|nr:response regulator [Massilia sp. Dwa41.01b]
MLVADDVPQNLELLQLLMARRGHTMTGVADGGAVVEMAARQDFDLILMDFQMPVLDGLRATRLIREEAQAAGRKRVPVIAMTASVLPEHRRASVEAGMDGFASKPVDWFALSHEIARVLGLASSPSADDAPPLQRQVWNRHGGLHRWGGKQDAYLEALAHFHGQHALLPQCLEGYADAADYPSLRMLAHRARGVAGNLALEQLADALAELEALSEGEKGQQLAALALLPEALARVEAVHLASMAAIAAAQPAAAPQPAADALPAADLQRACRAAGVLREALGHGALDDAALVGLAAALAGHPAAIRVTQVQSALADFDFDQAQAHLDALLAHVCPMPQAAGEPSTEPTQQETMNE